MENVKTKKKKLPKSTRRQLKWRLLLRQYIPSEMEAKPSSSSRLPGGKSFFALGDDIDSDDDKDEEEEDDLKVEFATNWVANPSKDSAADEKAASGDDSIMYGILRYNSDASSNRFTLLHINHDNSRHSHLGGGSYGIVRPIIVAYDSKVGWQVFCRCIISLKT
ncbi:hypothetical protein ACHAW5_002393 [Stephanodiscus triporus]|uniref:Uncharacterized protein n=1 Tax=Stephanodiscus triporus TaxID=2934178 RepID=A0ABD3N818_9STRA